MIIHHVVEEISDLLMKSSNENASSTSAHLIKASTLLSSLTEGNIQQQKQLLSHLLHDYFQSKTNIEVGTQVIEKNIKYISFFFLFLDFTESIH
jgi:hypothetical protein